MYSQVQRCRICGNDELVEVLDLGIQALTGVFPRTRAQRVTAGPLQLVKCHGRTESCGLLQLAHTYDAAEMYGENYGYRSGLNQSMVTHLHGKVRRILERVDLGPEALVVDIGSNDGTTLSAYPSGCGTLVGIDPTADKFRSHYPPHVELIGDFFSAARFREFFGDRKATVVSSLSMFYDLDAPLQFMHEVADILDDDGVWVFEQSYMPTMLARNSYDTVCHEHLEYYSLAQIEWMATQVGLQILDVEFNDINGGSFSVVVTKARSGRVISDNVAAARSAEAGMSLGSLETYRAFARRVVASRDRLRAFFDAAVRPGQTVAALGASTKGNVILQYCGLTAAHITSVGEVNDDKFGCYTPGSLIPIVPEPEVLRSRPDYLLVLPWHFRRFFESSPRFVDQTLVYPLPELELAARSHA